MERVKTSSLNELMLYVVFDTLTLCLNPLNSILTGFLGVVAQFFILMHFEYLPHATSIAAALFLVRWSFNVIRKPNTTLNIVVSRDHFYLLRTVLMIPVVICINMCDYSSIWNVRLSKTSLNGISLMDLGVIGFVFINAFGRCTPTYKIFSRKIIFLTVLGFIRLFTLFYFNLEAEPTEYGCHLNFYFILAALDFLYNLYKKFFRMFYLFDTVIASSILHFYYKYINIDCVFNENRVGLFMQNKEGFFSLIPLFCLYLIINDFSRKYECIRFRMIITLLYTTITATLYTYFTAKQKFPSEKFSYKMFSRIASSTNDLVKRRSTNFFYISYALFITFFAFNFTFILCKIMPAVLINNPLVEFISKNMMLVFLIANIAVLAIKLLKLTEIEGYNPLKVNITYLFVVFVIVGSLRRLCTRKRISK